MLRGSCRDAGRAVYPAICRFISQQKQKALKERNPLRWSSPRALRPDNRPVQAPAYHRSDPDKTKPFSRQRRDEDYRRCFCAAGAKTLSLTPPEDPAPYARLVRQVRALPASPRHTVVCLSVYPSVKIQAGHMTSHPDPSPLG